MMAHWSPKHVLVMLLSVFLTAAFSLSGAQASVMSARMTMATDSDMVMRSDTGRAKMSDVATAADRDCQACLKGTSDTGNPMPCPPTCIGPALAVLPQGFAVTVLRAQQPTPSLYLLFPGHVPLPDPSPPRPSDHA